MKRTDTGAVIVDGPSPEYEQACLQAVQRALLNNEALKTTGIDVKTVDLVIRGDERLIVAAVTRFGRPAEVTWELYEDVFNGTLPPGQAEDPESVALAMWVWAQGG